MICFRLFLFGYGYVNLTDDTGIELDVERVSTEGADWLIENDLALVDGDLVGALKRFGDLLGGNGAVGLAVVARKADRESEVARLERIL